MFPRLVLAASLFAGTTSATLAVEGDWPQWRGPQRSGAITSPPLLNRLPAEGLSPLWIVTDEIPAANNGGWSSPVVADGRVYLFTHSKGAKEPEKKDATETIYALAAQTGDIVWTNRHESRFTQFPQSGTPLVVDDRLYILGAGLLVRCLDTGTGEDLWETQLPGKFTEEVHQASPVMANGKLIVLAGRLFALSPDSGDIVWEGEDELRQAVHSSPTTWNDGEREWIVAHLDRGETILCDPDSGKVKWRTRTECGPSSPVIVGDRLLTYGSSRKKGLRCFKLSAEGTEHLWTFRGAADPGSSPVVVDGYVYVQGERRMACVALEDGQRQWQTELPLNQPRYSSSIAADGKLIYAYDSLLVMAAKPDEYQLLAQAKIDSSGRLADERTLRRLLKLDEIPLTAEGAKQADRKWRESVEICGPLPCASPALVDGRLFLRLKQGLVCYDLRQEANRTPLAERAAETTTR